MVYLVGAGPGNPGLITLRGYELLKQCDALLYDRLGTNELLEVVPKTCKKIYVGKKPGEHYKSQEEINEILVEAAKKYERVVRLKGGDPYVFGRGGEEVIALKENAIPYMVVPGVTSAIGVPELAGIPVTHRQISRGFHVYTGHTKDDMSGFEYIDKHSGTSVFLMGIANLEKIVERLVADGQSMDTPVAVISNGTLPGEKLVRGCLSDIVNKVRADNLPSPAIIVVGDTAGYNFCSDAISPIAGLKIGVVGSPMLRERMRIQIEEKGAQLFSLISMDVEKTEYMDEIETELTNLDSYTYIAFTSGNSIKLFLEKAKEIHFDYRNFSRIKFAVVGSGCLNTLREYGFEADFIPRLYTTKALATGLADILGSEDRVLIPRALRGSDEMLEVFKQSGIHYKVLPIYDVSGNKTDNWLYLDDFDVITFASGSGVEQFVSFLNLERDIKAWESGRRKNGPLIAAIGNVTAEVLGKYGLEANIIPKQCNLESMIEAIEAYFQNNTKV